jgi:hypothetical protein
VAQNETSNVHSVVTAFAATLRCALSRLLGMGCAALVAQSVRRRKCRSSTTRRYR